jgi:UDP-galactopyranose mutase
MTQGNNGVLCFAHLRWNFVYQRPQHVMTRLAASRDVVYYEEPEESQVPSVRVRRDGNVTVATPQLPSGLSGDESTALQRSLLDEFLASRSEKPELLWYYTPMSLEFSDHLEAPRIYDCMDELSAFKGAPPELLDRERELLANASLVFTGGRSLYYAKRRLHDNVHCFPSSVEAEHFAPAGRPEPEDMRALARPRIGFYGVIDERFDCEFVAGLAAALHDWQLFFIGPVVKIDPAALPIADNVHYLGMRSYDDLPAYLEYWDVALLPFALNDATRFISPTKTLEYLAARKPVISTAIADVVDPYGRDGLVHVARTPAEAAAYAREALARAAGAGWNGGVDRLLQQSSWDATVRAMETLLSPLALTHLESAG